LFTKRYEQWDKNGMKCHLSAVDKAVFAGFLGWPDSHPKKQVSIRDRPAAPLDLV